MAQIMLIAWHPELDVLVAPFDANLSDAAVGIERPLRCLFEVSPLQAFIDRRGDQVSTARCDETYCAQELFQQEELTGYLKNVLQDTQKSVYEHVVYDSGIESDLRGPVGKE